MATQHHHHASLHLPRLHIPNFNPPRTTTMDPPMFTPASAFQPAYGFPYALNTPGPMQTPMQTSFFPPHPPGAPSRPTNFGHRAMSSMAQLAAVGIHPPPNVPMTPSIQGQFPPNMILGQPPFPGSAQPFLPRSRRTTSMSTGGPPKAVLGGPNRKLSPMPPALEATPEKGKAKKVPVKIPVEGLDDGDESGMRSLWSRTPLYPAFIPDQDAGPAPELTSAEPHPDDSSRLPLPPSVDVYLPGKGAWQDMKQMIIEEKLQKLSVEKGIGIGSSRPEIHMRAASISSPADPALLYFKLNKLQQSQNASLSNSLAPSPQPSNISTSPNPQLPPRFQNRHGHSMSLAPGPTFPQSPFDASALLDAFSPQISAPNIFATNVFAPQGRVPVQVNSLQVPLVPSRPESRPDFVRGFGLDIPEEEEEEEEHSKETVEEPVEQEAVEPDIQSETLRDECVEHVEELPLDQAVAENTKPVVIHTRHTSRISIALSVGSVGLQAAEPPSPGELGAGETEEISQLDATLLNDRVEGDDDSAGEWTGSEEVQIAADAEASDDEGSIGEWSNPSDEERARQQRLERRVMRRLQQNMEKPRRLPNFPKPPEAPYIPFRIEDDVISNPSEEGEQQLLYPLHGGNEMEGLSYLHAPDTEGRLSRPLPPLPHSRNVSGQLAMYDAFTHSRDASGHGSQSSRPGSTISAARRESLNPFAKPFVFGGKTSGSFTPGSFSGDPGTSLQPPLTATGSTFSLNAAAREFKPGGFTFRPPAGVPELAFPEPLTGQEPSRSLSDTLLSPSPRPAQGREKRHKSENLSDSDIASDDEVTRKSALSTYRFPPGPDTAVEVRRSAPASPQYTHSRRQSSLNASAKPFTFSGFSNMPSALPFVPKETRPLPHPLVADSVADEADQSNSELGDDEIDSSDPEMPIPQTLKQKRAPIPLDFKHPVSTNMVPAGLFKNLVNTDMDGERVRSAVRSRLSSREIYDYKRNPSLDDLTVPAISHKVSRQRLRIDPEQLEAPPFPEPQHDLVVSPIARFSRRSSMPHVQSATESIGSIIPPDLARLNQPQQYDERLEALLDRKLEAFRRDLRAASSMSDARVISSATEDMVKEAIALFRTQMHESAAHALDDSQLDARGELDFEMIKEIIEQGHEESRRVLQQDISEIIQNMAAFNAQESADAGAAFYPFVQELKIAISAYQANIVHRLETLETTSRAQASLMDRDSLVYVLLNALAPQLNSLRSEPIDYESLTTQLSQAVKPHISQLIDLASDKRETAGLIVDRILPVLQSLSLKSPAIDTENLIARVTADISRIIGPIDAHVMKEQVADLVVERLDSRLAVRDMAMNADGLVQRVTDGLQPVIDRIDGLTDTVEALGRGQDTISSRTQDLSLMHEDVVTALSELPERLAAATVALGDALEQIQSVDDAAQAMTLANIERSFQAVVTSSGELVSQAGELLNMSSQAASHMENIPDALSTVVQSVQAARSDILSRLDSKQDTGELRKVMTANADLQVQLAKARGAHGQVRVEKDILNERLQAVEQERDRLRGQINELHEAAAHRATEYAILETRNADQEQAMHAALERLKASDVSSQSQQERIVQLEKANRELALDKQQFASRIDSLELQVDFAMRDKEASMQALNHAQADRDQLAAQQDHWEEFRRTAHNVETLTKLIGQGDSEEVKELKREKERAKALEVEHAALQRRFKEQESKVANMERASTTARQGLAQAQQRATEWEKKAREFEGDLDRTTTQLEQLEATNSQLDADYSLVKLQLEEAEAQARMSKDRETKLQQDVSALYSQIARLTVELEQAKKAAVPPPNAEYWRPGSGFTNGHVSRPSSRASTAYGAPATPRMNGQTISSRTPSVAGLTSMSSTWDSMHAPKKFASPEPSTPRVVRHDYTPSYRSRVGSPTPSAVSVAPTQGDDGWWS